MLDKAIARLAGMQAPNGGFSLWGNLSEYQYWLSAYITNFLLDAREQGFNVPPAVEKRASNSSSRDCRKASPACRQAPSTTTRTRCGTTPATPAPAASRVLAYGAYVLARQGKAPLATLRQLHESQAAAHSGLALVHLGLALKLMGDEARARSAIEAGMKKPRRPGMPGGATTAAICATGR
jgi:uncharacterized protein YfaS (alpha-2-macroglobulin family)